MTEKVCKVCGTAIDLESKNWPMLHGKPEGSKCKACLNQSRRMKRVVGPGSTAAQVAAGWGRSESKKGAAAAAVAKITPGVWKKGRRRVRRNPGVRLELQGELWMVRLSEDGQWWPATDAEVELWLRLEDGLRGGSRE